MGGFSRRRPVSRRAIDKHVGAVDSKVVEVTQKHNVLGAAITELAARGAKERTETRQEILRTQLTVSTLLTAPLWERLAWLLWGRLPTGIQRDVELEPVTRPLEPPPAVRQTPPEPRQEAPDAD